MANQPSPSQLQQSPSPGGRDAGDLDSPFQPFATAMSKFQRCSFTPDGGTKLEFAYSKIRYRGGHRTHMHEFLHQPKGKQEAQGTKSREIVIDVQFVEGFNRDYAKLYPDSLTSMVGYSDDGIVGVLSVPGAAVGSMRARCVDYSGEIDVKLQSGEMVSLTFVEADDTAFDINEVIQASTGAIADYSSALTASAAMLTPTPSIFDEIQAAVNQVLAIKDQGDLFALQLQSRLAYVSDLCSQADEISQLKDPSSEQILDDLHNLWQSANQSAIDLLDQRSPLQTYVCPTDMSAAMVAGDARTYGDASRAQDIIQLNPSIEDPFLIPAGTPLQFYPGS